MRIGYIGVGTRTVQRAECGTHGVINHITFHVIDHPPGAEDSDVLSCTRQVAVIATHSFCCTNPITGH